MRYLLLALALLSMGIPSYATTGSVNMRSSPATLGTDRYFVVFIARGGSLSGHALVVLGRENHTTHRTEMEGFGLYPKVPGLQAYFGPVDGKVVDELDPLNPSPPLALETDKLIVETDQAKYNETQKVIDVYKGKATYNLITSDCVSFVANLASVLGLSVPGRSWTTPSVWMPQAWIAALIASAPINGAVVFGKGIYIGPIVDGKPSGDGMIVFPDGTRFDGAFASGAAVGPGNLYTENGNAWQGLLMPMVIHLEAENSPEQTERLFRAL